MTFRMLMHTSTKVRAGRTLQPSLKAIWQQSMECRTGYQSPLKSSSWWRRSRIGSRAQLASATWSTMRWSIPFGRDRSLDSQSGSGTVLSEVYLLCRSYSLHASSAAVSTVGVVSNTVTAASVSAWRCMRIPQMISRKTKSHRFKIRQRLSCVIANEPWWQVDLSWLSETPVALKMQLLW